MGQHAALHKQVYNEQKQEIMKFPQHIKLNDQAIFWEIAKGLKQCIY